ncbi:hypothetical protein BSL78_11688 [Apostichopus japonicus]|uniref:Uncharacterized protein n=1 Tax=Stichopus japonicus TaxID=307972 RepID=A0A2G8KTT8_STIJA|nr:hypothetical protein BSL78_11688 [Apostichopus japonicus]
MLNQNFLLTSYPPNNATIWTLIGIIGILAVCLLIAGSCAVYLRMERKRQQRDHVVQGSDNQVHNDPEYDEASSGHAHFQPRLPPDGAINELDEFGDRIYSEPTNPTGKLKTTDDLAELSRNEIASFYGETTYTANNLANMSRTETGSNPKEVINSDNTRTTNRGKPTNIDKVLVNNEGAIAYENEKVLKTKIGYD